MINRTILEAACHVASELKAKAVVVYSSLASELPACMGADSSYKIVLVAKENEVIPAELSAGATILTIPNVNLSRIGQIKIAVIKGIAIGLFKKGDKLVCLSGVPRFGYVDSMFVLDVGKEFEFLTSENITDITKAVYPEVFGAVLNISLDLAAQGREGRKVGTTFILGDHEKVLQFSRQMIINPFMGYTEEERNILNPELKETIKEFSAIDGAFIVKDDGVIVTAGRHLNAALESREFPQGLGSRHIAAAGITSITDAVAVVLSESTGNIVVFKNGKIFVCIEKPAL
jgi:diadenylate cyclase